MVETTANKGYVSQIIGPVLDIKFPAGNLPPIYSAIRIPTADGIGNIVEVQQLLGDNKVRAVSMRSTDGLKRGVEAVDLGAPITVPVGITTLGRIFNVIGEPVDEQGDVLNKESLPIHREAPAFTELETKPSIFETGIKVVVPTGTLIGLPKLVTITPRCKPSVERIDTARTLLSPNNCCTSAIFSTPSSLGIRTAV